MIETTNSDKRTPLHLAAKNGHDKYVCFNILSVYLYIQCVFILLLDGSCPAYCMHVAGLSDYSVPSPPVSMFFYLPIRLYKKKI